MANLLLSRTVKEFKNLSTLNLSKLWMDIECLNCDPSTCFWLPFWGHVDLESEVVSLRTSNPAGYPIYSSLKDYDLENMMPIREVWSVLYCSGHCCVTWARCDCLAGIQSHCPDNVDDIQAVARLMKSSTDQCNSSGQLLCSVDQW